MPDDEVQAILLAATPSLGFYAGVMLLAIVAPHVAAFGYLVTPSPWSCARGASERRRQPASP